MLSPLHKKKWILKPRSEAGGNLFGEEHVPGRGKSSIVVRCVNPGQKKKAKGANSIFHKQCLYLAEFNHGPCSV